MLKGIRYLTASAPVIALFPDGSGIRRHDYWTADGATYTVYETRNSPDEPWGGPFCHYWAKPLRREMPYDWPLTDLPGEEPNR